MSVGELIVIVCGFVATVGLIATVIAEHVFPPLLYATVPLATIPMAVLLLLQVWAGISGLFPRIRGSI